MQHFTVQALCSLAQRQALHSSNGSQTDIAGVPVPIRPARRARPGKKMTSATDDNSARRHRLLNLVFQTTLNSLAYYDKQNRQGSAAFSKEKASRKLSATTMWIRLAPSRLLLLNLAHRRDLEAPLPPQFSHIPPPPDKNLTGDLHAPRQGCLCLTSMEYLYGVGRST